MSTFSTLLRYVYFFHDAPLRLFLPRCCAMTNFSSLLRYVYFFPRCSTMSPFSTLINFVYPFPRCCTMSTFSMLLRSVYFWPAAPLCHFSSLLCYVYFSMLHQNFYFFNYAPLCLLFPCCSPGRVAQSVTCLATDACLTTDPGVASSIPARSHTFVEIDHEIISTVILLPSADSFKKGCCQLQAKVCAQITG